MSRIAYVNGRYMPRGDAMVHIEDRGYQFSDGVYEVCEVRDGRIIDERRHMARLERSLDELRIPVPMSPAALGVVMRECVRRNRVRDGIVYLQMTRGVARRDHAFPPPGTNASVVVTARNLAPGNEQTAAEGIAVITVPDNRWERVDIKSISLLPNVLAKAGGAREGCQGSLVRGPGRPCDRRVIEQCLDRHHGGKVVTRPADKGILRGITRSVLIEVIRAQGLEFEERPFTVEEAYGAREAFLTSASQIVLPVVRIDDRPVGNGAPGSVATALRAEFHRHAEWS